MSDYNKELFETISNEMGSQKLIGVMSALKVYYGVSNEGHPRLSFLSTVTPPKMESTKLLSVIQGKESEQNYWTNFDLLEATAKQAFYTFCSDLVNAVENIAEEKKALIYLKNRYYIWQSMFKRGRNTVTTEMVRGLFGELRFLDDVLISKYGVEDAINAWSGTTGTAKDFSRGDEWFEVKAVSSSAVSVKISSISQLTAEQPGHLIIIKLEAMSSMFTNGQSSIGEVVARILAKIDIEESRELFLGKIQSYGINLTEEYCNDKFNVVSVKSYLVDDLFPRILETDIKYKEICKLSYELIINSLEKYKEG
jgi:hypothetical protein